MTLRSGVGFYVWQDPPVANALDTYDFALVRAANGNSTTNNQGFDFATNYAAWKQRFGPRIQPWTYLYPTSSGNTAALALIHAAGAAPVYQCDLEDAVPPATIKAFVDRLHLDIPGCKVVFDSYPTKAQFVRVTGSAATWDQAVASFDAFNPQVYYASQADDGWEREFGGKPILPAFSPSNWAAWSYFQSKLDQFGSAALWRYPSSQNWKDKLSGGSMALDSTALADIRSVVDAALKDFRSTHFPAKTAADGTPRTTMSITEALGYWHGSGIPGIQDRVGVLPTAEEIAAAVVGKLPAGSIDVATLTASFIDAIKGLRAGIVS
jgi:hypothetical protein